MTAPTRRQLIARRIALSALVGVVAVVFLSSAFVAGIIAVVTIAAVLVDSIAYARFVPIDPPDRDPDPQTIIVDLSRRS